MRLVHVVALLVACKSKAAPPIPEAPSGSAPIAIADAMATDAPVAVGLVLPDPPIATDGELLPNAQLTIGSTRFRPTGLVVFVGNELLVVHQSLGKLDLETGKTTPIRELGFVAHDTARLPGDRLVIAGADDAFTVGKLAIWSAVGGLEAIPVGGGPISRVSASPDGKRVAISGVRRIPAIIELATKTEQPVVDTTKSKWIEIQFLDDKHWLGRRTSARPDSRDLGMALGLHDELVVMRDGRSMHVYTGLIDAKLSATGTAFVTRSGASNDQLVDLVRNKIVATLPSSATRSAAAWRPDGTELVIWRDGTVEALGIDGKQRWTAKATAAERVSVSVAADGRVAVSSELGIELFGPDHEPLDSFGTSPRGATSDLAFAGTKLVSGGADNTVRIWDIATGKLLASWAAVPALEGIAVTETHVATLVRDPTRMNKQRTGTSYTLDRRALDGSGVAQIELPEHASSVGVRPDGTLVISNGTKAYRVVVGAAPVALGERRLSSGSSIGAILPGGVPTVASEPRSNGATIRTLDDNQDYAMTKCQGHAYAGTDLAAKSIAIADTQGDLRLWRRAGQQLVGGVHLPSGLKVKHWGAVASDDTVVFPTRTGVLLWNPATPTKVWHALVGSVRTVAFAPNGIALAIGFSNGQIGVYSLAKLRDSATSEAATAAPAHTACVYEPALDGMIDGMPVGD